MIMIPKRDVSTEDLSHMTRDELESERRKAKECFDLALVQKTGTDRIYVDAATWLNTLDRLVKKVEQRAALAKRAADRSLLQAAQV